jgi:EAL domain-containing protein (putative c-di-GMP-specific phosphodiesterase class I)
LLDVVRIWVDATLRLTSRDLRLMQRLISRQDSLPHTQQRVHSVKDLRDALDEDRLVLFAQPVVRLADGMAVHYEILARIRDHDGSQVLPDNFIGLAESVGIIQEMDLRVVERLLGYLAGSAQASRRVFVNLSPVSIADQRWIGRFVSLMRASAVDPGQLVFEVTEAAAISDIDATLAFMRRLKDMGCRFALDRFGSGLSSFRYFRQLEADYVKIDGGFVRDRVTDEGNRIFVKAMNDVARGLKKQVIAEWVESPEVLKVLIDMGAEYGQGYLFQRPSPLLHQADELTGPAPLLRIA